jgi:hypothetical protein
MKKKHKTFHNIPDITDIYRLCLHKMGTHEVRKSGILWVSNHYKMGTHDVKKTLGLRFVKEIQTFGVVIGPHSIVSFG